MKQLDENSFQTSGNMTGEELLHYLDENGEWYFNEGDDRMDGVELIYTNMITTS